VLKKNFLVLLSANYCRIFVRIHFVYLNWCLPGKGQFRPTARRQEDEQAEWYRGEPCVIGFVATGYHAVTLRLCRWERLFLLASGKTFCLGRATQQLAERAVSGGILDGCGLALNRKVKH
jgi:hypothetical protein